MNILQEKVVPYAKTIAQLLKGDIDSSDKKNWKELLQYEENIHDFVNQIGLELIINKDDGYALLKQFEIDEQGSKVGLKTRTSIGYEPSVICILLRELLYDFENNPIKISVNDKWISHNELKEYIENFLKDDPNRKSFLKNIDKHIKYVLDLGFLEKDKANEKIADNPMYKIKKIIKEQITIEQLNDFKNKTTNYDESV